MDIAACVVVLLLISGTHIASTCMIVAKPFLKMGAISYALYVIHMPILYFVAVLLPTIGASFYWMPLAMAPICFLAWWLEAKYQARVSGWLDSYCAKLAGVAGN